MTMAQAGQGRLYGVFEARGGGTRPCGSPGSAESADAGTLRPIRSSIVSRASKGKLSSTAGASASVSFMSPSTLQCPGCANFGSKVNSFCQTRALSPVHSPPGCSSCDKGVRKSGSGSPAVSSLTDGRWNLHGVWDRHQGLEKSVLRSSWNGTAVFGLRQPGRQQRMQKKVEHGVQVAIANNDNIASADEFLEEKDFDDFLSMEWKDGELDGVFEKFGETVYVDPNLEELAKADEDDSEVEKFAIAMATAAYDTKGVDIRVLHVKPLVQWTRYFVIVSAFSRPQIDAITKRAREVAADVFDRKPYGDSDSPSQWTLIDFGDVIMHIFLPKERAFYDLEGYYVKAKDVELPFVSPTMT